MTHYEIAFKLQHDEHCPYSAFSKAHPSAVVSHWCNWRKDVLEITHGNLQQDEELKEDIRGMTKALESKIMRRSMTRSNLQVVFQSCACDKIPPPTVAFIEARNCLELQPAVYTEGWEWYRLIAFNERDIKNLFKDLEKYSERIEVVSRRAITDESLRDTFLVSTTTLFSNLTKKQIRALITALDNGYYRKPRGATAEEIAERMGVPRTSFVDHLRKAENKVLQSVGPYLRMNPPVT